MKNPKILLLTTILSSDIAADALGQMHREYPTGVYIIRTIDPAVLPETFYVNSLKKGIDGIIIASAGFDCPFEGAYEQLSKTIDIVHSKMKSENMDLKRVRLISVCSVCTHSLLKEINQMHEYLLNQR